MKWSETTASQCRYSEYAQQIFGDQEILLEDSKDDYQGQVALIAVDKDGVYSLFQYNYGSCSDCDTWEANKSRHVEIIADMTRATARFSSLEKIVDFLKDAKSGLFTTYGKLPDKLRKYVANRPVTINNSPSGQEAK